MDLGKREQLTNRFLSAPPSDRGGVSYEMGSVLFLRAV
jgi:hypothetical protein